MHHRCRLSHHVRRILARLWPVPSDYRVSIVALDFVITNILTHEESRMSFVLRDSDPGFMIALTPTKDRAGIAPPAGTIVWSCSDPGVLAIDPAPDGLSCRVTLASPAKLGVATVTAKDTAHPRLARKAFDFEVVPEDLEGYDATVTPLGQASGPAVDAAPAAQSEGAGAAKVAETAEHQVVS